MKYSYRTLLKLKQNPYYKLNEEQQRQLDAYENQNKVIHFGKPPKHPTGLKPVK